MTGGEILVCEAAQAARDQRQTIAQRQEDRRARAGCQAKHACLANRARGHHDLRRAAKRTVGPAGESDDRHSRSREVRQESCDLLRLARLRQAQHDVVAAQHAKVAVHRLGRMEKVAGGAGGGERGRDLLGDEARLPNPRDDDLAGAACDHPHGPTERRVERSGHLQNGVSLGAENPTAMVEHVGVGGLQLGASFIDRKRQGRSHGGVQQRACARNRRAGAGL